MLDHLPAMGGDLSSNNEIEGQSVMRDVSYFSIHEFPLTSEDELAVYSFA